MYDTSQPRIAIRRPPSTDEVYPADRELGQAETTSEAMFFLRLGYSVHVSRWDGNTFVSDANYFPADL